MALEIFRLIGSVFVDTDKADKSLKKTDRTAGGFGKTLANGFKAAGKFAAGVGAAAGAAGGALVALTEATRDYRAEMGKLDTAFDTAGHSSQAATAAYKELQGVIGETDQSVEAAQQIALLANAEEDVAKWSGLAAGVVGRFGDALQPETFFEAANETIKLGEATGAYVQMLEGTGYSVEQFNKGLAACNTEAEKQAYMLKVTDKLLGEAADKYRKTNAEVIRANKANEEWTATMAGIGAVVEPVLTDVKLLGASLLADLVPGITKVVESFRGLLNGDLGAASEMGEALSGIFEHILSTFSNMIPKAVEIAISLVSNFAETIVSLIPQLLHTIQTTLPVLLQGLSQMVISLVSMIRDQLPVLFPILLDTIVGLITMIAEQLPVLLPQIVALVVSIIEMLGEQLPVLIPRFVDALIAIVELLVSQLDIIIPMLIEACIVITQAIIQALPGILLALVEALPSILRSVWNAIVAVFSNLPSWFGQLFRGAVDIIRSVFGAIGEFFAGIWAKIKDIFSPVIEFFSGIFSKASQAVHTVIDPWVEIFKRAWARIKEVFRPVTDFFKGIWSNIKSAFGSVADWFKSVFSKAWQAVKNVFSTGGKIFDGIKEGIANVFKTVVNKIIGGINKVITVPFNAINNVLRKIKSVEILGIKPFNWVNTFKVPQIPQLEAGAVLEKGQMGLLEGNGAEAVVPLHQNQKWINAVAEDMDTAIAGTSGGRVIAILLDILAAIEELTGMGIFLDKDTLVGELARPMDRKLGQLQAAKGRA